MTAKKKTSAKKAAKKAPATPQALAQEMLRMLTERLGPNNLILPDDLMALMASLQAPQASDQLSDEESDARAQALDLAFDAYESSSPAQARKLAKRALRLDPDCVDALLMMTELDSHSAGESIDSLKKAVEAGERSLGAAFIRENKGSFWMLLETRPYMRALEALGAAYLGTGMRQEAIRAYERILELNPNDNQGVRDPLLGLYLAAGEMAGAKKLLRKFKDDAMANFAWGRVLERLLADDEAGARAALVKARQANRFVEQYLTGKMRVPTELPGMYSPGSEEEATLCMGGVGLAWSECEKATFWLLDQCAADGVRSLSAKQVPSKQALKKTPAAVKRVQ